MTETQSTYKDHRGERGGWWPLCQSDSPRSTEWVFPWMVTLPVIDLDQQCLTLLKHLLIETLGGKDKRKISWRIMQPFHSIGFTYLQVILVLDWLSNSPFSLVPCAHLAMNAPAQHLVRRWNALLAHSVKEDNKVALSVQLVLLAHPTLMTFKLHVLLAITLLAKLRYGPSIITCKMQL